MSKYRANLHVSGITGDSAKAARSALDEQLRKSGLDNYRVVSIDLEAPPAPAAAQRRVRTAPSEASWERQANAGGLLLVAAAAWAIWFFWWMLSAGGE
jgi:ferric-dicitrate binding protein FerR (iron transport regulator)